MHLVILAGCIFVCLKSIKGGYEMETSWYIGLHDTPHKWAHTEFAFFVARSWFKL